MSDSDTLLDVLFHDIVLFKNLLMNLKRSMGWVNFKCNENGMSLCALGVAHVCLIEVTLSKGKFFKKYEFSSPTKEVSLGLNLELMGKVMECAEEGDFMNLRVKKDGTLVRFVDPQGERTAEFQLKLLEIEQDEFSKPDMKYFKMWMDSKEFGKVVEKFVKMEFEAIEVAVDLERWRRDGVQQVTFSGDGDAGRFSLTFTNCEQKEKGNEDGDNEKKDEEEEEGKRAKLKFGKNEFFAKGGIREGEEGGSGEEKEKEKEEVKSIELTLGILFLQRLAVCSNVAEFVSIEINVDCPAKFSFQLTGCEAEEDEASIVYYVAPRVDEE